MQKGRKETVEHSAPGYPVLCPGRWGGGGGLRVLRGACRLPAQADTDGDSAASIQGGPFGWAWTRGAWPLPGEGVEAQRLEGKRLWEASPKSRREVRGEGGPRAPQAVPL